MSSILRRIRRVGGRVWKSDGTAAGTVRVAASDSGPSGNPTKLTVVDDTIFYVKNSDVLWKTDGTEAGTLEVQEFSGNLYSLIAVNGRLVLADGGSPNTLYASDGTADGTVMVSSDFQAPGTFGYNGSLHVVGDRLMFNAYTADTGWSLWTSDGTAEGAAQLHPDIEAWESAEISGKMLFSATHSAYGNELWAYDLD